LSGSAARPSSRSRLAYRYAADVTIRRCSFFTLQPSATNLDAR
jgi:hypothetical protein